MHTTSIALDHLLRAVGDPIRDLQDVNADHPEFVEAQRIRAAVGILSKSPDALPDIERAVRGTPTGACTPRTLAHLSAARAWLAGDPFAAAEHYAAILQRDPGDLLALRLAQSCYFFIGWHDRLCTVVDAVVANWKGNAQGLAFARAMASFAHAENGHADCAERLGMQALAVDPACPYGVHAVAHAMAESYRAHDGARWMRSRKDHWAGDSRMRTHNAWHLAMFDLAAGDLGHALCVLDDSLIPAAATSVLDACDATALLRALASAGVQAGARWATLSECFERALTPGFWPYVDLHAAVAHAGAGNRGRLHRLRRRIEACADGQDFAALRARHLTLPGIRSLVAWLERDRDTAARLLTSILPLLGNLGGSRVQLEIFEDLAAEVCGPDFSPKAGPVPISQDDRQAQHYAGCGADAFRVFATPREEGHTVA